MAGVYNDRLPEVLAGVVSSMTTCKDLILMCETTSNAAKKHCHEDLEFRKWLARAVKENATRATILLRQYKHQPNRAPSSWSAPYTRIQNQLEIILLRCESVLAGKTQVSYSTLKQLCKVIHEGMKALKLHVLSEFYLFLDTPPYKNLPNEWREEAVRKKQALIAAYKDAYHEYTRLRRQYRMLLRHAPTRMRSALTYTPQADVHLNHLQAKYSELTDQKAWLQNTINFLQKQRK